MFFNSRLSCGKAVETLNVCFMHNHVHRACAEAKLQFSVNRMKEVKFMEVLTETWSEDHHNKW